MINKMSINNDYYNKHHYSSNGQLKSLDVKIGYLNIHFNNTAFGKTYVYPQAQ